MGALVSDQNGTASTQYALSNAHVIALGATGTLRSNSGAGIYQPGIGFIQQPNPSNGYCYASPADKIGTLGTVIYGVKGAPDNEVDAALALLSPGTVSAMFLGSTIGIGNVPATGLKQGKNGTHVQMIGAASGLVFGTIMKIGVAADKGGCTKIGIPNINLHETDCGLQTVQYVNQLEIKPDVGYAHFGFFGDSGSMVTTTDPCPQPVGLYHSFDQATTLGYATPIAVVLKQLTTAGAFTNLGVVAGCQPSSAQIDANVQADSAIMVPAAQAQADEVAYLEQYPNWIASGVVSAVTIDLSSGSTTIDVEVENPPGSTALGVMQYEISLQGNQIDGLPLEVSVVAQPTDG